MSIPTLWQSVRLEQAIDDMQSGFAQRPDETDTGVPQLRTNNVSPEGNIDLTELKNVIVTPEDAEKYDVQVGDVIFNNTNSVEWVGKTAYFAEEGTYVLSNHMTRIRANPEVLDPKYLARYLHFLWQTGRSRRFAKQWVNQAAIDRSSLGSFELILPPLSEQRRIAAILHEADTLCRQRREADERSRDLLPAVFQETFGDLFSEPPHWKKVSLSKLGQLDRGRSRHRPRDARHLYGGPYPFIQTGDVTQSNGLITTYHQTYSDAGLAQSKLWPKGTLCITIAANIARTGILTFDSCFPDSIVGFIPGELVTAEYVQQCIDLNRNQLERFAPQFAQKNINLDILRSLEIPCPPLRMQREFALRVQDWRVTGIDFEQSKTNLTNLFHSLLTRAFTGELTATWRESRLEQLRDEAVQRDIALGLRGTEPTLDDLGAGRVTRAEQEEADRLLAQALEQFRSIPSTAFQGLVSETFGDAPTISIETILSPQSQMLEALRVETSELFTEQLRPVAQALAQRLVRYTESLAQLQAEALRQPMLQAAPELTRQLATWFSSIGRLGEVAQALATRKPLRDVLGNDLAVLLDAISAAPAYFRADMLENDEISLIQAEEGLRLLGALGIVRPVQVRGQAGYRLVSREREQAVPEGLGL